MSLIKTSIKNRIATVILDRPEKRNALSPQLIQDLQNAFNTLIDDETVKVIILKSSGSVFCAGADLAYIQQLQHNTYEENLADSKHLERLFYTIYTSPKVVISQVDGLAIAGGCGLAFCTDFTFASPQAEFGYSEVNIGFVPALVSVLLTRKVGESIAKYLLLSGLNIKADEAFTKHLIHGIFPSEHLEEEVLKFAQVLVERKSQQSLALTKELIHKVQDLNLESGLDLACVYNAKARGTEDCKKGISNFLTKQPLMW